VTHRRAATAALSLLLLASAVVPAGAGDPAPSPASVATIDRARREAIAKGCAFLKTSQRLGGHFGDDKGVVAITALSTLALMADGSGIGRGPHGKEIERGVEFLLGLVETPESPPPRDGYFRFGNDASSKMHGQGYATLALASALGSAKTETAERIRAVLRRAVACAEGSQTGTGGWGYEPDPAGEHEGSVTVTIAQGLRAARDAGILVSADVVKRGLAYLRRSQRIGTRGRGEDGSFKYSLTMDRTSYALTAAALSSFFLFGEYADPKDPQQRIPRAVGYLMREMRPPDGHTDWYFYGQFYAAWAAWQLDGEGRAEGDPGALWATWQRTVLPDVLAEQRSTGSWYDATDKIGFGDVLPTAFAVLTLAIPDEQIPIFQR
jgi:hypothetical protein